MVLAGVIAIIVILCVVGGLVVYYVRRRSGKVAPEPSRTGEAPDPPTSTGAAAGTIAHPARSLTVAHPARSLTRPSQPLGENVHIGESYCVATAEGSRNTMASTREELSADSIPASPKHRLAVMSAAVSRLPSVSAPSPMPEPARIPNRPDGEAAHDDENSDTQTAEHVRGRPLTQDRSANNSFVASASRASTPLPPPAALSFLKVRFAPNLPEGEGSDDESADRQDAHDSSVSPVSNRSDASARNSFTESPRMLKFLRPDSLSHMTYSDPRTSTSSPFTRTSQAPGDGVNNSNSNRKGPISDLKRKAVSLVLTRSNTPLPRPRSPILVQEYDLEDEILQFAEPLHIRN